MGGLIHRIASVEGWNARRALWAEAILTSAPLEVGRELEEAVLGAAGRDAEAVAAYLALLDLPGLAERAGHGRLADVLLAAREAGLEACLLLLEAPARRRVPESREPLPDPLLDALTLGHRKSAARGLRGPLLERVLKDPDPRVVQEVLRNPRLRESEVLAIASRRPCPPEVFWTLVRCETWIRRPAVRRAIASNPHAPPGLAVSLLVLLSDPELSEFRKHEGLHPDIREGALRILAWRGRAAAAV